MPLTHIMYPDELTGEWKPIDIRKAHKLFGNNRIKAQEEYLVCSLCHEYVIYTQGDRRDSYFKHRRQHRPCPDESVQNSIGAASKYQEYFKVEYKPAPIKLEFIGQEVKVLLGLLPLRQELFEKVKDDTLLIRNDKRQVVQKFKLNLLEKDKITYIELPVEDTEEYKLDFEVYQDEEKVFDSWPKKIIGFHLGAVFDGETRRLIPRDSKVLVNHEYHILHKRSDRVTTQPGMEISNNRNVKNGFVITSVTAKKITQPLSRLFYHYWMTLADIDDDSKVIPLWPEYRQNFDMYYFYSNKIMVANTSKKRLLSQYGYPKIETTEKFVIIQLLPEGKNKLLLIGNNSVVIDFANLRQGAFQEWQKKSRYKITTDTDGEVNEEEIPNSIKIKSIDEETSVVKIYQQKNLLDIIELNNANKYTTEINDLTGKEIRVYRGLELVKKFEFIEKVTLENETQGELDQRLLNLLQQDEHKSKKVRAPKNLGQVYIKLKNKPLCRQWLLEQYESGYISAQALNLIRMYS